MKKAIEIWPNLTKDMTEQGQKQMQTMVEAVEKVMTSITKEEANVLIDLLDSGYGIAIYDALVEGFMEKYPGEITNFILQAEEEEIECGNAQTVLTSQ